MTPDAATASAIKSVREPWLVDHAATSRFASIRQRCSCQVRWEIEVMILLAVFLSGVVPYVVGSLLERYELEERERRWRVRYGRDETPRTR